MDVSFDTVISIFSEIIDNKLVVLMLLFVTVVTSFFYIRRKAKSGFSISNKFFIFCIGYRKKESDALIDYIIDVEKFNFHYNTNATSKRQIARFETWVRKYELDFRMISKLKGYFDIERLKVVRINKLYFFTIFLAIFVPLFVTIQTLNIAFKSELLVNVGNTGWFWINTERAAEFSFFDKNKNPWVITPEKCDSAKKFSGTVGGKNAIPAIVNKNTVEMICHSFSDKSEASYINKSIKVQRGVFYAISFLLVIITLLLFKHLMSLTNTYDCRRMIHLKLKRFK